MKRQLWIKKKYEYYIFKSISKKNLPIRSSTEIKKDTDTKIEINLSEGATLDDIKNQIRGLEDAEDIDYTELDDE